MADDPGRPVYVSSSPSSAKARKVPASWQQRAPAYSVSQTTHVSDTFQEQAGSNEAGSAVQIGQDDASSPELSSEQAEVERLVLAGENVFFTGNAGTGKSFLLNRILVRLREQYGPEFREVVAITAATGIAATHIGGTTLHTALGMGIPHVIEDFGRMWRPESKKRIRKLKVLVVDEISMVSAELWQHSEAQARNIRSDQRPFGGIQLVLCGDFFQLPPIEQRWHPNLPADAFLNRGFTFQCPAWRECRLHKVLLTKVFRQRDPQFVTILDAIRGGDADWAVRELVRLTMRELPEVHGVAPTELFSRNQAVDEVNRSRLAALPESPAVLPAADDVILLPGLASTLTPANQTRAIQALERNEFFGACLAPASCQLKVEAQVMLLKNLELGSGQRMLVNGSRGVVTGFIDKQAHINAMMKEVRGAPGQQPGSLMDEARPSGPEISRLMATMTNMNRWRGTLLPVVKFLNGRQEVILPELFSADVPGQGTCRRVQVPLKLAWALTIHKCQGMTLDRAKVSLRNMFAEGQSYVALSRVRGLEGLQILDWAPGCVKTNSVVKRFYQCLGQGIEYEDSAWQEWQRRHPSSAPSAAASGQGGASAPSGDVMSQPEAGDRMRGGRGRSGTCFKCGQEGHWARDCPGGASSSYPAAGSSYPTATSSFTPSAAPGASFQVAPLPPGAVQQPIPAPRSEPKEAAKPIVRALAAQAKRAPDAGAKAGSGKKPKAGGPIMKFFKPAGGNSGNAAPG